MKLLALLAVLVAVATTQPFGLVTASGFAALLGAGLLISRLPVTGVLARAAVVLPFTVTFAGIAWLAGEAGRAFALIAKPYLSALAVLLVVATTPMPALLAAASSLGVPRMLVLVLQFLYRYLFVVAEQAQHMWVAAQCRGAALRTSHRAGRFRAASGTLAVLFARSYEKAEGIERSMLARCFDGRIRLLAPPRLGWRDLALLAFAAVAAWSWRWWVAS